MGCVDLAGIAKFAAASKAAADGFPQIVSDMEASCRRRAELTAPPDKQQVLEEAERYKSLAPDLNAAQTVVTSYLQTMGDLSTNQPAGYSKSLEGIGDKLGNVGFDAKQASAGATLASKIADASLNAYRSQKLRGVIGESNQALQVYLTGLKKIVGADYVRLMKLEELALNTHYQEALKRYQGTEPLTALLVERQWEQDKEKLNQRKQAAAAYTQILDQIAKAHQTLYDNRDKTKAKELFSLVAPYVEQIGKSAYELYKAI
jgi:rubrerythrin